MEIKHYTDVVHGVFDKLGYVTASLSGESIAEGCWVEKLVVCKSSLCQETCVRPDYVILAGESCGEYMRRAIGVEALVIDTTCTLNAPNTICLGEDRPIHVLGALFSILGIPLEEVVKVLEDTEEAKAVARAYAYSSRVTIERALKRLS